MASNTRRTVHKLIYQDGSCHLQVSRNDVVFWVDGVKFEFRSVLCAELLALLIAQQPNTVPYQSIFDNLRTVLAVGSEDRLAQMVHKVAHNTRQDLVQAGLRVTVLRNVRKLGYRLEEGWTPEPETSAVGLVEAELQELHRLVHRCIDYVDAKRVVENRAGLLYLDAERHVVEQNFLILDRIGWQLLHSLGEPELVPTILNIKNDLSSLMSYVVFWRVGHRLTGDAWKDDYRQEILQVLGDIEIRIIKIKEFYAASASAARKSNQGRSAP